MDRQELWDTIKERLDLLERLLKQQEHIRSPDNVREVLASVSKFYTALSSDDREYVEFVRVALEGQVPWNV